MCFDGFSIQPIAFPEYLPSAIVSKTGISVPRYVQRHVSGRHGLESGFMNDHGQCQPDRIFLETALASVDFLARNIAM
jgi:hypothetical protein